MYNIPLSRIAQIIQARIIGYYVDLEPKGAAIDSRKIKPGYLFFAFQGEKTDGHCYLHEAEQAGAVAAIVSYLPENWSANDFPLFLVQDVTKALQKLASVQRELMPGPVIAITGSTGKTTTKDMLTSILAEKGNILSTQGNYNNQLGLPLTLLALEKEHWAIVLEMGMGNLGEIDILAKVAQPTHGIVTNIGHAHEEVLGSQESIAQAKAELFTYLPKSGALVLNQQDRAILKPWLLDLNCAISWIDYGPPADLWVCDVENQRDNYGYTYQVCTQGQQVKMGLNIPGRHNIINSLSAIGIARKLGLSWSTIKSGLDKINLTPMRLEVIEHPRQKLVVINDAYNANPDSMISALDVLKKVGNNRRKIAVLGNMYELGSYSVQGHLEVGTEVSVSEIDYLLTVGDLAGQIAQGALRAGMDKRQIRSFMDNQETLSFLQDMLIPDDVVLVKGSRGVQMEEIVQGLLEAGP